MRQFTISALAMGVFAALLVSAPAQADTLNGDADYLDGILTLAQAEAPALAGKIVDLGEKQFGFELIGGPQAATIRFSR